MRQAAGSVWTCELTFDRLSSWRGTGRFVQSHVEDTDKDAAVLFVADALYPISRSFA